MLQKGVKRTWIFSIYSKFIHAKFIYANYIRAIKKGGGRGNE